MYLMNSSENINPPPLPDFQVSASIYEHEPNVVAMFENPHHINGYSRFSGTDPHG